MELTKKHDEEKAEFRSAVNLASLGKRTLFGIIDFVFFLILFVLLLAFPVEATFNAIWHTRDMSSQLRGYALDSGLYKAEGKNTVRFVDKENYYQVSFNYYETYCADENSGNICSVYGTTLYEVIQNEEGLKDYFEENDEKEIVLKEEYNNDEQKEIIYQAIYGKALKDFSKNETYSKLNQKANLYVIFEVVTSIVLSSAVFYLLIPLCLPDGKTLGKLMMKASLTNTAGFKVKKSQIVVRYVSFMAFNIFSVILSMFSSLAMLMIIVPFISFTMMIFSKKQTSLHDMCSATIVVDDTVSVIYSNRQEYDKALESEQSRELASQRRRRQLVNNDEDVSTRYDSQD